MREWWWWCWGRRLVELLMTGNGRCQRRRKMMGRGADGGSGTEEKPAPVSGVSASKAPALLLVGSSETKDSVCSGADLYCQALKVLSVRSPFDSAEASATTVPTLPSALGGGLLARQSEVRKRHKKLHSGSKSSKQGLTERPKSSNIWVEYEEYFGELTLLDIDMLQKWSTSFELLVSDSCLSIPSVGNSVRNQEDNGDVSDAPENAVKQEICMNEASLDEEAVIDKEEIQPMDIDNRDGDISPRVAQKSCSPQVVQEASLPPQLHSISSLEWVLGSRNKILLTTERPTKKRKLLGENAGLQRLVVAKSCKWTHRICHFCSGGDSGDQLNQLFVCSSCGVCVHQKCYGIQGDVDESWVCSWCKWKNDAKAGQVSKERGPCVLCPTPGGALKPVRGDGAGNDLSMEFAHLFCSLWMAEVYVDDMRTMEPILNVERIKEARRKLICNLCKVRHGTCVRCTEGSCRTSFHPICAREAGHRLEVWGKLGCDDIELRAFCSKHSHSSDGSLAPPVTVIGSHSPPSDHYHPSLLDKSPKDDNGGKRGDQIADCMEELDGNSNKSTDAELLKKDMEDANLNAIRRVEHTDISKFTDKDSQERSMGEAANAPVSLNLSLVLKKLIDRGKVSLKDLASEIGVPADSLAAKLADDHLPTELRCKIIKWLGDHAFIATSQKKLTVNISVPSKVQRGGEDGSPPDTVKESNTFDLRVKFVPPRRRTTSSNRIVKDSNVLSSCKDPSLENGEITDEVRMQLPVIKNSDTSTKEFGSNGLEKVLVEHVGVQDLSVPLSPISESIPAGSLKCGDFGSMELENNNASGCSASISMAEAVSVHSAINTASPYSTNVGSESSSFIHPYIQKKILEIQSGAVKKSWKQYDGTVELNFSHLKQSSKNGVCPQWDDQDVSCTDVVDGGNGVTSDDLIKAKEKGILDLDPEDEVEGELVYFQHWLFGRAAKRKRLSDNLICKIVKNLPQEQEMVRKQRWESVLVHQYLYKLREAKKQGRKEKKYKEAQAILAAAAAAVAASSRTSLRKDAVDEVSHQQDNLKMQTSGGRVGPLSSSIPRVKETTSCLAVSRNASDKELDILQLTSPVSKEHQRLCDICGQLERILNPIFICSSCKVAVHLDCYRSVKESTGPWYCEFCEDSSAKGSIVQGTNSLDKPNSVTACGLCGNANGAFRKSSNGQWVHAFCAEWVFESTFRRGQVDPIEGLESVKGNDICSVCHRRFGACIRCNYGLCHSTFHPSCARSACYYMTVHSVGGKLQRKAYCDKHSIEQRAKIDSQKHGIEELKSLKEVRVELEKLRLICERIVKREKLKRELVLCSHDLFTSKKDTLAFSPLFQNTFFPPEASSESATTSLKGHTDCSRSCSDAMQKSDDVTVDSTVSGKCRIKLLVSPDSDQRTDGSSTSEQLPTPKPTDRVSFAGKHIPPRASLCRRNIHETGGKKLKSRKHTETFEKELIMTSDQASMKNQRLPKGYIYVPIDRLSTDEQTSRDSLGRGH